MKTILITLSSLLIVSMTYAQPQWTKGGNDGSPGNLLPILGTNGQWNQPLLIHTFGKHIATFSNNNGLYGISNNGEGLRIMNPTPSTPGGLGQIDIFTSVSNHTEIRFGGSGNIRGANLRFEEWGHYNGFFFNTSLNGGIGVYKFARAGAVTGFIGTNNFWRIGMQLDGQNLNGARRLEVLDNTHQFRLTFAAPNTASGPYTDFLSNSTGNLQILPQGQRVGINVGTNPTHNLEVNGNTRIRNVPVAIPNCILVGTNQSGLADNQVSRLDFTGNASQVLLGNGTWGTIGSGIGTCAVPTVLTTSAAIDLNNQNFNFLRNGTGNSNLVNIGEPCATPFLLYRAKLNVLQTGWTTFDLGPFTLKTVVAGRFNASASSPNNHVSIGVLGIADGSSANYGVVGVAPSGVNDRAGYFVGDLETTAAAVITSDQQFKTDVLPIKSALDILSKLVPRTYYLDTLNYKHFNFGSEKQYGFIAQELETVLPELVHNSIHIGSVDSIGNVIGERTEYKSLNYNAIIPINTQAINELNQKFERATLSDGTIKSNVQDLTGSLAKVLLMRGVDYDWNGTNHPNLQFDSSNHIGFIAQEINAIDSRLTFIDEDTLMHVVYEKVVPILAEAIGELNQIVDAKDSIIVVLQNENLAQQSQINDLNARLTLLENCLSNILPALCNANQMAVQQTPEEVQQQLRAAINVNLSDRNAIVLNQNVPNPFAESTVITFTIPETVQKAQIHFYDGTGKLINSVDIVERGNGQMNVFANDLSTGVYTCSLVADGQIVSTKRMMKQ